MISLKTPEQIDTLITAFRVIYPKSPDGKNRVARTGPGSDELERDYPDDPRVMSLVASIRRTALSTQGRYLETLRTDDTRLNPVK